MASSLRTFTSSLRLALPLARPTSARSGFRPIPSGPSSSRWASTSADVNNHGPYLTLGELANNKGATKTHVRLGRGWSSTKGGTSGRGHKGQKARAGNGKPKAGFEGGQTPITRLFPKRGFNNFTSKKYAPVNLSALQAWVASGRLDASQAIDVGLIFRSNLVHGIKGWSGVKLLGEVDPALPLPPLNLRLSRYSKSAAKAIKDAGGEVTAVYHNPLALRQAAHPEKFVGREVKEAKPVRKTDILYYSNPAKHGYLAKDPSIVEAQSSSA
ncbi:ribosomal protein L18e/L15P [Filobasidium floriforme]|uniref:ribosomal protein L18e/L15P n=1 Tax=Filobasidium floriforme TaxID=5210 RepID=UPI001E8CEE1E|nr:ribosomal protein L18e/L15P [Filobasidium floriforme]KAH8084589.1 ribosomal protein L18e/L15P [Filobasidium floriforme]